ncbi:Zn(2)-Cys(6) binuclear cluster domain-containing protein [Mycena filopes]|nr:Zn(2)-Cys(6) binuclear cluster domain-containing protein [Mycena filopes]
MTQTFFSSSPTSHSPRSNLPRGKACMNCRRRKIKCDGHKPICSQCMRSPGTAEDCEYPLEGRSRTQQLEETIKKLQSRIGELEATTANSGPSSIFLHEPYDAGDAPFLALDMPGVLDSWSIPGSVGSTSPSTRVNSPASSSSSSGLVLEEPPSDLIEGLVDIFLERFQQVGFFLDVPTFRHSASLMLPFGHYDRPSTALLGAVYTWGARLSSASPHPIYNEAAFLSCTLQNIHQDLSGGHPRRVLHTIQAEVLLSLYYLTLGRPVEGIYHSTAAVSLALSAGLHLIKSSSHLTLQRSFGVLETPFQPPANALEEAESINAFWTVLIVNNYWAAAHGSPSAIPYHDTPIDTPWPLEVSDYGLVSSQQQLFDAMAIVGTGGSTVSRFLAGFNVDGFSPLALLAKASILLERATSLSARYSDCSDAAAFDSLDLLLCQFEASLPPIGSELLSAAAETPKRSLLVTQTLTHAAIIRLHAHRIHSSEVSRGKYMTAARAVVHIINSTDFASKPRHVDPILGILWSTVSEVFVAELSGMRSVGYGGGVGRRMSQQHQDLVSCLETVQSTMRVFSGSSPLIEYFAARIERAYQDINLSS